jgi:hypothetical protein
LIRPSPLLHYHYSNFFTTTRQSAPNMSFGNLSLWDDRFWSLPLHLMLSSRVSVNYPRYDSCCLYAGRRTSCKQVTFALSRNFPETPGLTSSNQILTLLQQFSSIHLPYPHLTAFAAFLCIVHYQHVSVISSIHRFAPSPPVRRLR